MDWHTYLRCARWREAYSLALRQPLRRNSSAPCQLAHSLWYTLRTWQIPLAVAPAVHRSDRLPELPSMNPFPRWLCGLNLPFWRRESGMREPSIAPPAAGKLRNLSNTSWMLKQFLQHLYSTRNCKFCDSLRVALTEIRKAERRFHVEHAVIVSAVPAV